MAILERPITRKQEFYNAILNGGCLPRPITNDEEYLHAIATKINSDNDVDLSKYVKTVNKLSPDVDGNVNLEANKISCSDNSGYNKGNVRGYVDFLCNEVKEIRAILDSLTQPPSQPQVESTEG